MIKRIGKIEIKKRKVNQIIENIGRDEKGTIIFSF